MKEHIYSIIKLGTVGITVLAVVTLIFKIIGCFVGNIKLTKTQEFMLELSIVAGLWIITIVIAKKFLF